MGTASDPVSREVTIGDIARDVGVSRAVVSSLLSGRRYERSGGIRVSEATRRTVLRTARTLGYTPRDAAALVRLYPERGHYGVLIGRDSLAGFDQYYVEIIRGLVDALAGEPLNVNLGQVEPDVDYVAEPGQLPFSVVNGWTTKFVLLGQPNYSLILALQERGYQVIYLSRQLDGRSVASAAPDYEMAGELGVRHLLERGHRRIAMAGEHYFTGMGYHRPRLERGGRRAAAAFGVGGAAGPPVVLSREPDQRRPTTVLDDLLALPDRPTGVFCFCDYTASRLVRAAAAAGLRVPEDLSIVGCNDQALARDLTPALTTVHFPLRELGATALRHFRRVDAGEQVDDPHYVLPVSLVERQSVRAV